MTLITDKMVETAFDWLHENAYASATAKANRVRAEYQTKREKARLFLESPESGVAMREAWALNHADFGQAVNNEADAVERDEFHRNQRSKAEAIIDAWRTEQSNYRAMAKVA